MEKIEKFNIRVYGLLIADEKLLLIKDQYVGEKIVKFPGGGLEFGEGITDCLKREFLEELNLQIEIDSHFYTQENFLQSKFRDNEQLITIYYKVKAKDLNTLQILEKEIEEILWISFSELNTNEITLPIDKIVVEKLIAENILFQ